MDEHSIDLWPENFGMVHNNTPLSIMKRQATILGERTQQLVTGRVISTTESETFYHKFFIYSTPLDYSYYLFRAQHEITLYPVIIDLSEILPEDKSCKDEQEFIESLKWVFNNEHTLQIIRSLISQSQNAA